MNILLCDYSPVPETPLPAETPAPDGPEQGNASPCWTDLCRELQDQLDRKNIRIEQLFAGEDSAQERETLRLFSPFNGTLYTQKYAGILSYRGHTIQILSRFDRPAGGQSPDQPQKNFFLSYLLSKALDIPIQSFPDLKVDSHTGEFWDLLLARLFLDQLKAACSRGLYRQYQTFRHNDSAPRGVLDIARHIRLNPMANGKCAYSAREYSLNNPMNHLILRARDCLLRKQGVIAGLVNQTLAADADLRITLQQMEYAMDAFHAPSEQMILHRTDRPITHTVYREYEPLRRTARLILQRLGLDTFQAGSFQVSGMVIPMDKMWERFLEKAIFSRVEGISLSTQYRKAILENSFTIRPDFFLRYQGKPFVFDAKYKAGWGGLYSGQKDWNAVRDDLYQVISYLHLLKSERGGILFPLRSAAAQPRSYRLLQEELPDCLHLIPVPIPQSRDSFYDYARAFDESCEQVAREIQSILASASQKS